MNYWNQWKELIKICNLLQIEILEHVFLSLRCMSFEACICNRYLLSSKLNLQSKEYLLQLTSVSLLEILLGL